MEGMDAFLDRIFAAGVVGCGGAGFPTHVKLAKSSTWFLVNAAECEPLLRTDRHVMQKHARELVETSERIATHLGASHAIIALKKTYLREIAALEEAGANGASRVKLHLLENFYPAGDEHMIVQRVTGASVPPGGLPLDVGAVVSNAATVLAVHDALAGVPMTHRYLTVAGEIETAAVLRVPIGISVAECLHSCGWSEGDPVRVIVGGPAMGTVLERGAEADTRVTKTTSGLVVVPEGSILPCQSDADVRHTMNRARSACIQCNQCTMMCLRYLLGHPLQPHRIMRRFAYADGIESMLSADDVRQALLCSECGVCELFACPMGLRPRTINQIVKSRLLTSGIRYQRESDDCRARPELGYRFIPSKRLAARMGVLQYYDREPEHYGELRADRLVIPLKQRVGAPARAVVRIGEPVAAGQLLAECPPGQLGANIHCGMAGVIVAVDEDAIAVEASPRGGLEG